MVCKAVVMICFAVKLHGCRPARDDSATCLLLLLFLLQEQGAELVIALTHMRVPNDIKLATQVSEIDAVLGGHDHHVQVCMCADLYWPVTMGLSSCL